MMLLLKAATILLLLPFGYAEKVILDIYRNTYITVERTMICFGPNGFNFPLGSWGDGTSYASTLSEAMRDLPKAQCAKYEVQDGWNIGYDTFGVSKPFTAIVCGGDSNKKSSSCDVMDVRVQCDEGQVLAIWYQASTYRDCNYELVRGKWVRNPITGADYTNDNTLADPITVNLLVAPENMECTIEYSKATCREKTEPPVTSPPTTPPPTTSPPVNNGGDSGTDTGGGGDSSTGGDSYYEGDTYIYGVTSSPADQNLNIINTLADDEEKGCGSECIGAIGSVLGVAVSAIAAFFAHREIKKKQNANAEIRDAEGLEANKSTSGTSIPFGGPAKKEAPPEQAPEVTPMAVAVLQGDEEKPKKKKKKSISAADSSGPTATQNDSAEVTSTDASAANDASAPEDGTVPAVATTINEHKKKKKKKSVHKAEPHATDGELAEELEGPATKTKKKKKRQSSASTDEEGIKKKHTKKRASSKVVATTEDHEPDQVVKDPDGEVSAFDEGNVEVAKDPDGEVNAGDEENVEVV